MKNNDFNLMHLLAFYIRHSKKVLIFTALAALVSIVAALVITPLYLSEVIIFPASNTSISKELLTDVTRSRKDILLFGEDEEAEQLLQILYSDEIKSRIVQRFDLFLHYNIPTDAGYPNTSIGKKFANNINFSRTQYQAVKIQVYDKDPQMAANIAEAILELVDTVYNNIQKKRALGAYKIVEAEYLRWQQIHSGIMDSLTLLRNVGVWDYQIQVQMLTEALVRAIEKNNAPAQTDIKRQLATLERFGGLYLDLSARLESTQLQLALLASKLSEARVDLEQNLSHKFIVNAPSVPEKKAKPVRWLIVVISTISAFVLISVILIFLESFKSKEWKQIIEETSADNKTK
jgi:uncharacterized protein involved in exopolysaccharide biosynthesis